MRHAILLVAIFAITLAWSQAGHASTPSAPQDVAAAVVVPEPSAEAVSYYNTGNVLWAFNTVWGMLFPALLLFTGFSSRIRDWARRIGRKWFFVIAVYFVIYSAIGYLIGLPFDYYQDFVREHAYGMSNQTFGGWFADSLVSFAVNTILGALLLWIPYLLLKKSPRRWWLYTGMAAVPVIFLVLMITPIWIVPLFRDVTPMQNKDLEAKIVRLAEKAGIQGGTILQINSSEDSKALNAAVMGFGSTKRIVLTDTLIKKLDEDELLFGVAHEAGHYVLGHTVKMVLFLSILVRQASLADLVS